MITFLILVTFLDMVMEFFSKLANALQWRYLTLHSLFDDLVCTKSGILDLIARPSYHVQTFPNGGPFSIGDLYQ